MSENQNRTQELEQLQARIAELKNHLVSNAFTALDEDRIEQQIKAMETYANLLTARIEGM